MKLAKMPDGSPEIFHTLQGEGRNTGRPSVFIRSSLCNLHCHWCDTAYTWNWEGSRYEHESARQYQREDQIIDLSVEAIAEKLMAYHCPNYVFTGGEPLLHEAHWVELMQRLLAHDPRSQFEIETNGTLLPQSAFTDLISQFNVSPKLSNSQVDETLRLKLPVIEALAATGKADFKFVIGDEADFAEVTALIEQASLPRASIFLMPRALNVAELEANQAMVAALAQANGMNYSDRLHLRLYGAKRGV